MSLFKAAFLVIAMMMVVPLARSESVTIIPVADTGLVQTSPDNNMGGQPFFNSGSNGAINRNRGLMRFDLAAAIPAGSQITSATLELTVVGEPSEPPTPSYFRVYRVLRPWCEGNKGSPGGPGQGNTATIGEATWNSRMALTTNTWAVPGGAAGIDYVSHWSSFQYVYGIINPLYTFHSSSNTVADAQMWLDSPDSNFGWILISDSENVIYTARRFGSREAGGDAPQLTIEFIPPLRMENAEVVSNNIQFTVSAEVGETYTVQSVASLSSTNWQTVTNIGPTLESTSVLVVDPLTGDQKFYRIKKP